MQQKFELLAPGGDIDSIKAAIVAGADAVYCGLDSFNARNRAVNLTFEELNGVLKLAHKNGCQVFLTLNIIILEHEISALLRLLNKLVNTKIDGVIVQDLGLFYLLSKYFKSLDIHASTQVTTHNEGQILFLNKLAVSRVNLSRELNIKEIKSLTALGHKHNILSEVFVHGSYCIGFSGLCYFSSVHGGNSGNRGRCSQPCRDKYETTATGNDYPLNLKDNSAFFDLPALADAGVDSLKIEGRIKGASYVYTVVNSWKKQLQQFSAKSELLNDNAALYKVFNRDFSNGFLKGEINKLMFIDNPRDNTLKHVEQAHTGAGAEKIEQAKQALYDEKMVMAQAVEDKIKTLSIAKTALSIEISGELNQSLSVSVKTADTVFVVHSETALIQAGKSTINASAIEKRFKSLNNSQYIIESLILKNLQPDLFIPFSELTKIKNRIAFQLNDSVSLREPVSLPALNKQEAGECPARLAVLISCEEDLPLCHLPSVDIYYKLPDSFKKGCAKLVELFLNNEKLIPWFPAILIGDDYLAAVEFLTQLQPKLIVTNNTGIAYQAYEKGINWIAGPYLNISNSYSLLCIKEVFNCYGSFISNEMNKNQIKNIVRPDSFKLFYSIYHPILLMTSRQCFFQQTVGCKKLTIDDNCMQKCKKSASIINLKGNSFAIEKQKGGYPSIYSNEPFLNCDIVEELPGVFAGFFVDLTDIGVETKTALDKTKIITHFENLLNGVADSASILKQAIGCTSNSQYKKGL
ncbi:MAG: putative protease [Psychromonas sp.]|jgi:putative protease|uniref:peptidase U32 family protein n=1 Tax=Psychromonas sp. TaxID=1884585 RepID=UPI0039E5AEA5